MVRKGGVHEVTKRDPARSTVAQPTLPAIALSMAFASSFAVCGLDTVYHGPALTKLTVRSFDSVRASRSQRAASPVRCPVLETRVIPHCARVPVGLSFPAAHHAQLPCDYTQRERIYSVFVGSDPGAECSNNSAASSRFRSRH